MNESIITQALTDLAIKRPFFWSEADFQFAYSEALRDLLPNAKIRLERPFPIDNEKYYHVDIWVEDEGKNYPIELKYKTKKCSTTIGKDKETIRVTNQSANDLGRYDYIADIKRIENIKELSPNTFGEGYSIMLTNDASYYTKPKKNPDTMDSRFRIHENAKLEGELRWKEGQKSSTVDANGNRKSRKVIKLSGSYTMKWEPYSTIQDNNGITFEVKQCVTVIKNQQSSNPSASMTLKNCVNEEIEIH